MRTGGGIKTVAGKCALCLEGGGIAIGTLGVITGHTHKGTMIIFFSCLTILLLQVIYLHTAKIFREGIKTTAKVLTAKKRMADLAGATRTFYTVEVETPEGKKKAETSVSSTFKMPKVGDTISVYYVMNNGRCMPGIHQFEKVPHGGRPVLFGKGAFWKKDKVQI